jgi:hypothetical protein
MSKLTNVSENAAMVAQEKAFRKKLKKDYVDINDPNYHGPVTTLTVKDDLEQDPNQSVPVPSGVRPPEPKRLPPKPPAKKVTPPKDGVATCVNNSGMEDKFDQGIEYVCAATDDPTMIAVYDKFGEIGEYFADRFNVIEED